MDEKHLEKLIRHHNHQMTQRFSQLRDDAPKNYQIAAVNDLFILIIDLDNGKTVTNSAEEVIEDLNRSIYGGIGHRQVYYRDTMGRFDQLQTDHGRFTGFAPGTPEQQDKFKNML